MLNANTILLAFVLVILSGCYWRPAGFQSEVVDAPVVKTEPVLLTIVRKDSEGALMKHPTIWIDFDTRRIVKLEDGEYTQFQVSKGKHLLGFNWLESAQDIVTDIIYVIYAGPWVTFSEERSRWHMLNFENNQGNLLLVRMIIQSFNKKERNIQLEQYDEWPPEVSLKNFKFVPVGNATGR